MLMPFPLAMTTNLPPASKRPPVVVGIGEILWDRFPGGDRLGGAPANFAYHAGQLGAEAHVVSRVGEDEDGAAIVRRLSGQTEYLQRDFEQPTGVVHVTVENDEPHYDIVEPAAWDDLVFNDSLRLLAARTDAVCFGTLAQRNPRTRATIHEFVAACQPGAIRLFDINLRAPFYTPDVIAFGLGIASVLKLNEGELHEIGEMLGFGKEVEGGRELLRRYPNLDLVAVTLGADGSELFRRGDSTVRATPPAIEFCDAVGAGDSFAATLVTGLLAGQGLATIADRANRIAAFVASQPGATPLLPDLLRT